MITIILSTVKMMEIIFIFDIVNPVVFGNISFSNQKIIFANGLSLHKIVGLKVEITPLRIGEGFYGPIGSL